MNNTHDQIFSPTLSLRENIENYKHHNHIFLNIEFPQIHSMSSTINIYTKDAIINIMRNINFTYIQNSFTSVKIYTKTAFLTPVDLRNILKDVATLYIFLNTIRIANHTPTFEYSSTTLGLISPNIIYAPDGRNLFNTEEAIERLSSLNTSKDSEKSLTAKKVDSIKEKLKKIFQDSKDSEIQKLQKKISHTQNQISMVQDNLKNLEDEKMKYENELENVVRREFNYSSYVDGIKKITKIKGIADVELKDIDTIQLYTNKLYVRSMGYRFYVGKFCITVNMSTASVDIRNLDDSCLRYSYWGENCQHPHVSDTGTPCLGQASSGIVDACHRQRPDILAIILINYLESVNPDDVAGKYLTNWDIVDEDGNLTEFPQGCRPCHICGERATETNIHSFHICHFCGNNSCKDCIAKYPAVTGSKDAVWVCNDCSEDIHYCSKCGKITSKVFVCDVCGHEVCEECIDLIENKQICVDCIESTAKPCTHCGQLTLQSSGICSECANSICTYCHKCANLVEIDNETKLCADCFKNTGVCVYCGKRKPVDELIIDENTGIIYCKNGCESENESESE